MLNGTAEEFEYHQRRAVQELERSQQCDDHSAKHAHIRLAKLHLSRSELVAALRSVRSNRAGRPISGTDKEG